MMKVAKGLAQDFCNSEQERFACGSQQTDGFREKKKEKLTYIISLTVSQYVPKIEQAVSVGTPGGAWLKSFKRKFGTTCSRFLVELFRDTRHIAHHQKMVLQREA